jgi:hypothetical protein
MPPMGLSFFWDDDGDGENHGVLHPSLHYGKRMAGVIVV